MQLSVSNEKLAYSAIYGVFVPWTAQCHGILDLQRNYDCNLCLSPLLSPFSFRLEFLLVRIMCKSSFRNSKSDWTDSFSKWIIRAFQSDLEFRKLDLHMILTSREIKVGTDIDYSHNFSVNPEFRGIEPSKEQKLRKSLNMPISRSILIVAFSFT